MLETLQSFKRVGEAPIEIKVFDDGTLYLEDASPLVELDEGQVTLALKREDKRPLERSGRAEVVSVELDLLEATGVKLDVEILYSVEAGNTLVNLMQGDCHFLLKDGEVFTLPANQIEELPDPVVDVIFVTDEPAIARQARHAGRRDVVRPVLETNPVTGPIVDERGEVVLIRALV